MSGPMDSPSPDPFRKRDGNLTHLDETGAAHMVDVAGKPVTRREAVATGRITMSAAAATAIAAGAVKKGDVLAAARIAGIMAAKKTADLIPLCHPLGLENCKVNISVNDQQEVVILCTATITSKNPCAAVVFVISVFR